MRLKLAENTSGWKLVESGVKHPQIEKLINAAPLVFKSVKHFYFHFSLF